ncbi:MAG: hypothetical protein M3Z21_06680, partial [Pseudomonadota bacterium]|nr:hypothetical protein [Pseudomonadota bacterium]
MGFFHHLRLWPRSLSGQLPLLSSLILAGAFFGYTNYTARQQTGFYTETMVLQAQSLARSVASGAAALLAGDRPDAAGLRRLLLETGRFPQVLELAVTDAAGRLLDRVTVEEGAAPAQRSGPQRLAPPAGDPPPQILKSPSYGWLVQGQPLEAVVWEPVGAAPRRGWIK